ncbi:MAG: hypothetical protein OXN18_04590 [Gemmatimonadota bacterium]|nr:hypothetical protein [Gemmatimonadota bacterium]
MIRPLSAPLAVGLLVIVSALASTPALRDAATLQPFPPATLHHPPGYLLGAPLFGLWDALSLLTVSQHYAVLATLILLSAAGRLVAGRRSRSTPARPSLPRRVAREALFGAAALAALLAFYAAAALVPRPMAAIRLASPELVAVDFHSHTNHSHDGWSLFTAARSRAWHEAGGFHAAYVTDHYTWAGVDEALPANPTRAGEGTVLLSGMEVRLRDRHTNILGDHARYIFALDSTWHHLDPDSIVAAHHRGAPPASMLYTIPGPLDRIVPFGPGSPAGVIGVELSDGAPRGLEQGRAEREEILALADSMDLAVVAGTNHHGWGRTAPAWSVMRLPGWPRMSPDELGSAIEDALHQERRRAVTVVERTMPYHDGSAVKLAATVPLLLWSHFRTLTLRERVTWLAWVAIWAAVRAHRARHQADPS